MLAGPAEGKTVQLLLHGSTDARYYWDCPYQPGHYSYVRSATKRGYATFNLDRIGNGASDHPTGEPLSSQVGAKVCRAVPVGRRMHLLDHPPDKRGEAFYYLPNADPAVIALNESLKQTTTSGELNTGYEEGVFSAAACIETAVINDAGYDLDLHLNANAACSQMLSWADRHVGSSADPAPCGTP